jgi:glutathione synthase/RimK-type ligase-like ATP-grasp enzyme
VLSDTIDQRDRKFAGAQCRIVTEAALRSLSDQSFSVNPLDAGSRCHSKPYQLAIASRIGLRTPETIVTNCSAQLESFYAAHDGKIVHKPLQFSSWIGADGRRFVASTVKVTPLLLEHRSLIEHSPGIFQRLIDKAFEVRVHVIGSVVYAAKLFTKESSSSIDWRFDFSGSPPLCAFELPVSVKEKCLHFMAEAGLRFGCFDFIVDEQENYYFLEVNEMGQFLWVEINDPALPLLDAFSSFLLSGDDNFMHHRHGMNVRYSDFQAHYRANRTGYEQLSKRHVPAPIEQVIFEDAAITQAMLERGES